MPAEAVDDQVARQTGYAEGAGAAPRRVDVGACHALHAATNPLELIDAYTGRLTLELSGARLFARPLGRTVRPCTTNDAPTCDGKITYGEERTKAYEANLQTVWIPHMKQN